MRSGSAAARSSVLRIFSVSRVTICAAVMPPYPTAAIMSVALLLAHVGEHDSAARVDKAVEHHFATRGDEKLSTAEVGDRIAGFL